MSDALINSEIVDCFYLKSPDIVRLLLNHRNSNINEDDAKRPIQYLVKTLLKRPQDLESFVNTIATNGVQPGKCIALSQTSYNPELFNGRKEYPLVIYSRIWRWPNVLISQLKPKDYCRSSSGFNTDKVCVNPYHYTHVDFCTQMPNPTNDFYDRSHPLVIDFIPIHKQVEIINLSKTLNNYLLEKHTGVNQLHIKCILHRKEKILQLFSRRVLDLTIADMDGADAILLEWLKYYMQNSKDICFYKIAREAKHLSDLLNMPTYYIRQGTHLQIKSILANVKEHTLLHNFKLDVYTILRTCGEMILQPEIYRKFLDTVEQTVFIRITQCDKPTNTEITCSEIINKNQWLFDNHILVHNLQDVNHEETCASPEPPEPQASPESPDLIIIEETVVHIDISNEHEDNSLSNKNDLEDFPSIQTWVPQTTNSNLLDPVFFQKGEDEIFLERIDTENVKENKTGKMDYINNIKEYRQLEKCRSRYVQEMKTEEEEPDNLKKFDWTSVRMEWKYEEDVENERNEELSRILSTSAKHEMENTIETQDKNTKDKNERDDEEEDIEIVFEIEDADENVQIEIQEIINQHTHQNNKTTQSFSNVNDTEKQKILEKQTTNNDNNELMNHLKTTSDVICKELFTLQDLKVSKRKISNNDERNGKYHNSSNLPLLPNKVKCIGEDFIQTSNN